MFGAQTFFISKSLGYIFRIILYNFDNQLLNYKFLLIFFVGLNIIDWFTLILTLIIQFTLFTRSAYFIKNLIKFSSIIIYLGLILILLILFLDHSNDLLNSFKLSTNIENVISKKNIIPFISVVGTMFAYFSFLVVSFGDFALYAKNHNEMKIGNLTLLINIFLFSFLALLICLGSDIFSQKLN